MPGTGHSARYKGSISNRVRISPFQRLAEWNAQLLGADGAVPTITGGGGGLAFKKLDASDIEGVLHNPTKVNLHFTNAVGIISDSALKIQADTQLSLSSVSVIVGNASGTATLGFFGQPGAARMLASDITTLLGPGPGSLVTYLADLGLLRP